MQKLLSLKEVQEILGCSSETVSELVSSGMLPCIRFGRTHKVIPATLEALLEHLQGKDVVEEIERFKQKAAFSGIPGAIVKVVRVP